MTINNQAIVNYTLADQVVFQTLSNKVAVKIIKPIINFLKCGKYKITIHIENNNAMIIYNINYKDFLINSESFIAGSVIINNQPFPQKNPLKGIKLGCLKPGEKIILKYLINGPLSSRKWALLSYKYYKNSQAFTIFIISNFGEI